MTSRIAGLIFSTFIVVALAIFESYEAEPLRKLNDTKELAEARNQLMGHPWALLYYKYIYYSPPLVLTTIYDSASEPPENEHDLVGCHNLGAGPLSALNIFGTCVRVFHMPNCQGGSIAIYPNEIETIRMYTAPPSVHTYPTSNDVSVGPCLENEFETATFFRSRKNQLLVRKDASGSRHIPDWIVVTPSLEIVDYVYLINNWRLYFCEGFPFDRTIANYPFESCLKNLNLSRRVEKIQALITPSNLRPAQESTPGPALVKAWDSMDKQEGDVMGFVVPPSLTELAYEAFNVFPTSEKSRKKWEGVLAEIPRLFKSQPEDCKTEARMEVQFYYRNLEKTRPYGFYYWIKVSLKTCSQLPYYPPLNSTVMYGFHWI